MMTNKLNPFHAKSMIATALMATMIGVAACGAAATTSTNTTAATQQPTVAASASTTTSVTGTTAAGNASTETAAPETATAKINLNTATSEEFATVPDVGNRMVREFEEYRPYVSILQFRKEIGKYVDEAQVAAYEQYVYVPVVPNTADTETLQQLPGVTPEIADKLIAGRPYASNDAFLAALKTDLTAEQLAVAESYLATE